MNLAQVFMMISRSGSNEITWGEKLGHQASGDDLYKLLAFYQILYHITLCDVYM